MSCFSCEIFMLLKEMKPLKLLNFSKDRAPALKSATTYNSKQIKAYGIR